MSTKTHTTMSPKSVADMGLTIPDTLPNQAEYALKNLTCVPGFVMFPEPYKKSTDDYTGFPVGSLLMRYDGRLFVVDIPFMGWYTLNHITPDDGERGWSDSPSRRWVHENYLFVGQKVAK